LKIKEINLENLIDCFGELNLTMATGGSANFSAGGLATASTLTVELINSKQKNTWFRRKVTYRCKHSRGL